MRQVILLLSIFLIAGCIASTDCGPAGCSTGGGKITGGTSVVILKFEPDLAKVSEGDKLMVFLQVQNRGAFDAADTTANFYLHSNFDEENDPDQWEKGFGKLRAPNTKLGTEGQTKEEEWVLTAPQLGPGVKDKSYDFKVDVYYDYRASSWIRFPIIEYTRTQKLRAEGKPFPTSEEGAIPAPVKVDINVYEPVIFKETQENFVELKVILESVGEGFVKSRQAITQNSDCTTDLNCIDVVVLKIPNGLEFDEDCDFTEVQSEGLVEAGFKSRQQRFVNMIDGDRAQLDCRVLVPAAYMGGEEVFPLARAEAYYTHHITGTTNVEVVKVVGR